MKNVVNFSADFFPYFEALYTNSDITFKPKALLFLSVLPSYNSITESIKRFSVFIHKVHNVQNSVSGSIGVPDKNMYIDLNTIILDSIVS